MWSVRVENGLFEIRVLRSWYLDSTADCQVEPTEFCYEDSHTECIRVMEVGPRTVSLGWDGQVTDGSQGLEPGGLRV